LSIADPQLIKDILIAKADSYSKPLHIRKIGILGDGVFASSGSTWAPQRELFNGPFHTKEVKVPQFQTIFLNGFNNQGLVLKMCECEKVVLWTVDCAVAKLVVEVGDADLFALAFEIHISSL